MPDTSQNLTEATGSSLHWNYVGSFARLAIAMGTNVWLARLLGPGPFGQLAVAILVISFGNLVASVGMGSALIQREVLHEDEVRFCFTFQVLIGLAMSLSMFTLAPLIASFFHQPLLVPILRVFSVLFVLQAFGSTATALLNRQHSAKIIQRGSVASFVLGYIGVGVPLALHGFGVWSLVFAQLTQSFLNSVHNYLAVRHSIRPLLDMRHRHLLVFGVRVLGSNLGSWSTINLDNVSVGRFAGPVALGVYSRAFALAQTPADSILTTILQVLLNTLSRIQNDTEKLRRAYGATLGLILLVLAPGFCAMAAVPGVIILGLYGAKWRAAIALFSPLALAMPVHAAMAISGPLLSARGKPQREMKMQLLVTVIAAITFVYTVHISVLLMAWCVLAVYLLRFALLTRTALHEIGGGWRDLSAVWPGLTLSLVAALCAKASAMLSAPLPYTPRLVVVAVATAGCTLLCFVVFSKALLRPIVTRSPQIRALLSARLHRLLPDSSAAHGQ